MKALGWAIKAKWRTRERPFKKNISSTYLNRTAPWNEALGGPPVWFLKRVARMRMSGVKIPENAESFLCETKAVRGVVVETFD